MKKYCRDCKKTVEVEIYNDKVTPALVVCSVCGQFCYDVDTPK
jgi:hypothetical protein